MKDGSIEANNVPRITLQDRQVGGGREAGVKHKLIRTSITHTIWCVFVWFRRREVRNRRRSEEEEEGGWGDRGGDGGGGVRRRRRRRGGRETEGGRGGEDYLV